MLSDTIEVFSHDALPVYSLVVQIEELEARTETTPGKYRVTAQKTQEDGSTAEVVVECNTVSRLLTTCTMWTPPLKRRQ